MAMQESGEMYLETIYVLSRQSGTVRSVDVAEHLGYSKPSVSRAVGLLIKDGLLRMDETRGLRLTQAGEEKARRIYERHTVLTELFIRLGVDEKTATDDACRIEHYISDRSFEAVKAYMRRCADEASAR